MNPQLLFEELSPAEAGLMVEGTNDGKTHWLSGIFMQSGIKNRNGRIYSLEELSREVTAAKSRIQETNGIFGELDHPQSLNINLDRISHVITDLMMEGANAVGKAKLLDTPMGLIAKELVKSRVKMGVSSRGAGAVNESGCVENYSFVTADLVAQPSAPEAYPTTVIESLEQYKQGHNIIKLAEAVKEDQAAQKYFEKEILNWLSRGLFAKK